MAEYASQQAMDDIEALLTLANRSGEWNPDHEPMLDRWRAARGEAGLTAWRWWAKAADDDEYANELATREEAIAWARREYRGGAITIVEARCLTGCFRAFAMDATRISRCSHEPRPARFPPPQFRLVRSRRLAPRRPAILKGWP